MSRPDDPEQRIRDLEPPPVELGRYPGGSLPSGPTSSWTYEAPPTPAGTDRRWLSNLLLALGLVIIAAAAGAYFLFGRQPEPGTPTMPAVPGPSATGTTPPPSRTYVPAPPPTVEPAVPPADTSGQISGIDENRSVVCDGNTVTVSGISNTVTITGHCGRLSVSGIENVVTVDSADVIEASGLHNRITFHAGSPHVDTTDSNTVEHG